MPCVKLFLPLLLECPLINWLYKADRLHVGCLPADCPNLPFRPITFEGMHLACKNEAYSKLSTAFWTVDEAETLLRTGRRERPVFQPSRHRRLELSET
jgi:hypothetical protein